jgi:hypothetical protein
VEERREVDLAQIRMAQLGSSSCLTSIEHICKIPIEQ